MKIVVTGSLGNVSKPLTEALVRNGHVVTVISTNPDKQKRIEAMGATAAIGALEDVAFLTATFSGADVVFAMIPQDLSVPDPIDRFRQIGNNYAQAIGQAGIRRVVYLSSWGAHLAEGTGLIVGHYQAETILNQLTDVAITFLRPCSFYTNLLSYVGLVKRAGFIGTNYDDSYSLVMVSPTDIAAVATEALETDSTGKSIRYIASDERTCGEVATVLGTAIGRPTLTWRRVADEQLLERLVSTGMPTGTAEKLVELGRAHQRGALREDYDRHKPASLGTVKLEDFAREFAAVFERA